MTAVPDPPGRLVVRVWDHPDATPRVWRLECAPPGGDHPDPVTACAVLAQLPAPFAPVPAGALCAQVYGGPERATIDGEWRGEPVHAVYSRTDACENRRWHRLAAVLQP